MTDGRGATLTGTLFPVWNGIARTPRHGEIVTGAGIAVGGGGTASGEAERPSRLVRRRFGPRELNGVDVALEDPILGTW